MRGGKLRMLTVLDEYTRECRCIHVDRRINAWKVQRVMARLIEEYGAPEYIRSDNGSEFIESNLREWLSREGDQDSLNRARQPMAKRIHRKLPCPFP